jgi:hypothetical protein
MHDFTAPLSPQLAAALQRVWRPPTVVTCPLVSRETEARRLAQLDDWENEGGMTAPQSKPRVNRACLPPARRPGRPRASAATAP